MIRAVITKALRRPALLVGSALLVACASRWGVDSAGSGPATPSPDHATATASITVGREKAIAGYRDYLARYPGSPERDSISRRLADLLLEQGGDPQIYAEAINYYEYLLHKDPYGPQRTELLYQLSRAYAESGRSQQALAAIEQLLAAQADADPVLYADTRFRQGELCFVEGAYLEAGQAYQAVVDLGPSAPAYEQSLYKLGWSLFKQERYRDALPPLLTLLELKLTAAGADAAPHSAADAEQLADLWLVISRSFAQLDGVDSVDRYFRRVGRRSYEEQVYLQLAQWYVEQEQVSEAARTWLLLAQRHPLGPEAPRLTARAISLYRQAGFHQRVVATQTQFVHDYGMGSEFWTIHAPADFPDVLQLLQSSLQELSRLDHEHARRSVGKDDARRAERWYREYLASFGDAAAAARMNFQLAELLYENGRYRQALEEYERTAWSYGVHPQAAEAALAALHANHKLLSVAGDDEQVALAGRATADALRFVHHYPEHPAAPGLLAQAGTDLLEQQQYDRALRASEFVVRATAPASSALWQVGWSLQAQALFALEDYAVAALAYREALQLAANDDARRPPLQEGLAVTTYRQAERAVEAGDRQAAVALYLQAAELAPEVSMQSTAHYDAATVLLAQESWAEAIALLEQFRGDYPADSLQHEVSRKLAFAYQRSGDKVQAAREYMQLGLDQRQADTLQREALLQAADLYLQTGALRQAIVSRERYLERFPQPAAVAVELMRQLAELELDMGDTRRGRYWLEAIIRLDRSAGNIRTRPLAAEAALELAEHRLAVFRRVQLVNPVQDNLARKIEAMKQALQAFEAAIDYGISPVTTAATYHIASMYDELGSALLSSERPVNLSSQELAEYDLLLAQQAAPFEQQAIDLYTTNAQRPNGNPRDPWIDKSVRQLYELRGGR